jgi:predicted ATPase
VRELPSGTVTFLFTDIEGSTRLLHELGPQRYAELLAEHHRTMRSAISDFDGVEVDTEGDAFFVAFTRADDALAAAAAAQERLPVRVRMGIHTGEPLIGSTGYVGVDVHQAARIAGAAHGGQIVVSERTRSLVDGALALQDLGLHRLKDLTEPQKLFQLGDGVFPPLRTLYSTNLPVQPTPIVGRERELADVLTLLRSSRLLTLTGAGGSGKTRLALQAAAELVDEFPDGVWFVSLAALADSQLVTSAVRQALGAREDLDVFLRGKKLLLLLDNLEQLLPEVGPLVAGLDARVLATSRERLNVAGEQEYSVPTLPVEDAVALFTQRARLLEPVFAPDEHVTEIARRLDGLPLALELAAARIKVLTTEQIVERLERALDLLTAAARDVPDRQRTLRATVEWSHALLTSWEQELFAHLAVFPGSFALDAVEAVCGADLDVLQSLVDKSLLRRTSEGRFFLLETIREFADERLAESGGRDRIRERHAEHFLALVRRLQPLLATADDLRALAELDAEHGNLQAALRFFIDRGAADPALELINSMQRYWRIYGHLAEGRRWTDETLALRGSTPMARAHGLRAKANFANAQGDAETAGAAAAEALPVYEASGAIKESIGCLNAIAGAKLFRGDIAGARTSFEQAAALARRLDEPHWLGAAVGNLGNLALYEHDFATAQPLFEEAVEITRALGTNEMLAVSLVNAALSATELGALDRAERFLREALEMLPQLHDAAGTVAALIVSELLLLAREECESSALVGAGGAALAEAIGLELDPFERELHARAIEVLESAIGGARLEAAAAAGAELDADGLIGFALDALG